MSEHELSVIFWKVIIGEGLVTAVLWGLAFWSAERESKKHVRND